MVCIPEIERRTQVEFDKLSDEEKFEIKKNKKAKVLAHAENIIRRVHEAHENAANSKLLFK